MRVIRTTDTEMNLCDVCPNKSRFPTCLPDDVEFGNGIGDDNITACSQCTAPTHLLENVYVGEISKLPKVGIE